METEFLISLKKIVQRTCTIKMENEKNVVVGWNNVLIIEFLFPFSRKRGVLLFSTQVNFETGYRLPITVAQHLEVSAMHEQLDDTKSANKFEASTFAR